jgi:hypothetical protein
MPAIDTKRVLRDEETAKRVRAAMDAGRIPPLSAIFEDSKLECLTDRKKAGQTIIQISFIITNRNHSVVPIFREVFDPSKAPSGHTLHHSYSLLVSWSAIDNREHIAYPRDIHDIEYYYRKEVVDEDGIGKPELQFIGLAENRVEAKGITYLFYVWEVIYDAPTGVCPIKGILNKDSDDKPCVLQSIDRKLLEALCQSKVELRVLGALADRYALALDWPEGLDLAGSRILAATAAEAGQMGHLIDEPLPHVFISKTQTDKPFVDPLCAAFKKHAIRTWVDDNALQTGTHWYSQAEIAIHYAPVFLVVSSSNTVTSGVQKEIDLALALQRQRNEARPWIVPVVTGNALIPRRDQLPADLQGFLPLAAPPNPDGYSEDDIQRIVIQIKNYLIKHRHKETC